jgi:hypothetical protein
MKIHVSYTVEINDEERKEINNYFGNSGPISRDNLKYLLAEYGIGSIVGCLEDQFASLRRKVIGDFISK